jgi:NADH:ubiquinone oxidoreductase subunit D
MEGRSRFREVAMTDWDQMVESIQAAMQAVDRAHEAKESLRENANGDNLARFHAQMRELEEHLGLMKQILEHEDTYSMDEIADALGHALNKETSSYHRIPHYKTKEEK